MNQVQKDVTVKEPKHAQSLNINNLLKFLLFSLIGIFTFFIPITINGVSSIPLDHIVTYVQTVFSDAVPYYALIMIIFGAIYPFINRT